ncbi:tRNA 2-selenouridine synthase [Acididesulfobacillus acetoxydans]|uniref:tRNA 2-selenouridine synthase n=1 Tax=Acididesulfobacillus acetoxydans TaxID=1561005 RepID=A0A8S0XCI9_9FIRM|nr:tRNA 2-selenouridine(34) synthase MnmH [Acididesulfobacillus acetoxydans]CAA7602506.1 tRNA 2-selenouridine synthase [Acididesulfobacillus acetoxydans]CEJ05961.1 tRNA 2-selenouridine synthase [Acididesulfobacillus acetoxydans]
MIHELSVTELAGLPDPALIDVRSEGEFAAATIPGAVNLPLLNDREREEVGKVYTRVSPAAARELGLRLVSPKLPRLVAQAGQLARERPLVLFCWRGGLRSKALAQVLDVMGLTVYRLRGGYKAYRRLVVEFFAREFSLLVFVLCGNTGVGKTDLLSRLGEAGHPIVDLEGLAHNRGSVFGGVGLGAPPSQKDFEARFYENLRLFQDRGYVIVECESKRIGSINLPMSFYRAMQGGVRILVCDRLDNRIRRLTEEYTRAPGALAQIHEGLQRLRKILGNQRVDELEQLLRRDPTDFTRFLLEEYYDPLYAYPSEPSRGYALNLDYNDPGTAVKEFEDYLGKYLDESGFSLSGI